MRFLTVLLLLGLFFVSADAQNGLSDKDIDAIRQVEKNLETAFLKGDQAMAMSLVWDDVAFYPNGMGVFKGLDGVRKVWFPGGDSVHNLSKYDISLTEIYGEKNMATAIGTNDIAWTAVTPGKPEIHRDAAFCRDLCKTLRAMADIQTALARQAARG